MFEVRYTPSRIDVIVRCDICGKLVNDFTHAVLLFDAARMPRQGHTNTAETVVVCTTRCDAAHRSEWGHHVKRWGYVSLADFAYSLLDASRFIAPHWLAAGPPTQHPGFTRVHSVRPAHRDRYDGRTLAG